MYIQGNHFSLYFNAFLMFRYYVDGWFQWVFGFKLRQLTSSRNRQKRNMDQPSEEEPEILGVIY
jgi:hypothetical protein